MTVKLEQVKFMGARDGLRAAAYSQFAVDIAGVLFDRVNGDHQLFGDLRVGVTLAD